jgi:hypothetical protein
LFGAGAENLRRNLDLFERGGLLLLQLSPLPRIAKNREITMVLNLLELLRVDPVALQVLGDGSAVLRALDVVGPVGNLDLQQLALLFEPRLLRGLEVGLLPLSLSRELLRNRLRLPETVLICDVLGVELGRVRRLQFLPIDRCELALELAIEDR